ncbi:carbon-phosphorus lyase, partial [Mycobacterium sp. ITM-2017-0098]
TSVRPLAFDDIALDPEQAEQPCWRCGSSASYRVPTDSLSATLGWCCSDTDACRSLAEAAAP